jgi:hypothetical protein
MLRKNALARAGITPPRPIGTMAAAELAAAAAKERGPRLKALLNALEQRRGPEVLQGLARAAADSDKEIQELARELIDRHLYRQSVSFVQKALKDDHAEVRRAAVRLVASRMPALVGDLVDLLADPDRDIRKAAHQLLIASNSGEDLGPAADASPSAREEAMRKWRAWWESQKSR